MDGERRRGVNEIRRAYENEDTESYSMFILLWYLLSLLLLYNVLLFYPLVIKICSINALELYFFHCIVTFMAMAFNFY